MEAFDIMIYGDVFMDSFVAHLAMLRVASVQVCFWGHPFTTGENKYDDGNKDDDDDDDGGGDDNDDGGDGDGDD
jgi:hypothetical protein